MHLPCPIAVVKAAVMQVYMKGAIIPCVTEKFKQILLLVKIKNRVAKKTKRSKAVKYKSYELTAEYTT